MAWQLHQSINLTGATSHSFTGIPTSATELYVRWRGAMSGSGAENRLGLRPNNDSTAGNYNAQSINVLSNGNTGGSAVTTDQHLWVGQLPLNSTVNGGGILARSGGAWIYRGSHWEGAGVGVLGISRSFFGSWESNSAISTLRVGFDMSNSTNVFTGNLELWFQ